jgi:hypothetical protein
VTATHAEPSRLDAHAQKILNAGKPQSLKSAAAPERSDKVVR